MLHVSPLATAAAMRARNAAPAELAFEMTTKRQAACSCGKLSAAAEGDPIRISICHCHACQRRTGSVFGAQAR